MLVDVERLAVQHWNEYTARDIDALKMVCALAAARAAVIAAKYSEEAAQAILHD